MCAKCFTAAGLLELAGYDSEFREYFLWNYTDYPMGDSALSQTRAFLSVKRRKRRHWLKREDQKIDRAMARIAC